MESEGLSAPSVAPAPITLCLMAKAPTPGQVKTRMRPELTPRRAAQLAQRMLEQSVDTACRHWPGEVTLCAAPHSGHPIFTRLAGQYPLTLAAQTGADLGARMLHALRPGLGRAGCAAVMGCDVPHCPGEILAECHAMLARGENPLGPTEDGGFYLLGLQRAAADVAEAQGLFEGVNWSGGAERAEVRTRAQAAGLRFAELPQLRDIDHPADLRWLAAKYPAYRCFVS